MEQEEFKKFNMNFIKELNELINRYFPTTEKEREFINENVGKEFIKSSTSEEEANKVPHLFLNLSLINFNKETKGERIQKICGNITKTSFYLFNEGIEAQLGNLQQLIKEKNKVEKGYR